MVTSIHLSAQIDHLVVAAASQAEGVQWCESALGITPGPGGEHALMGTHNRVFTLASAAFPQAYFEIIAIHSGAACARSAGTKRWFDLDNPDLQEQLRKTGPRLIHFVARSAVRAATSVGASFTARPAGVADRCACRWPALIQRRDHT